MAHPHECRHGQQGQKKRPKDEGNSIKETGNKCCTLNYYYEYGFTALTHRILILTSFIPMFHIHPRLINLRQWGSYHSQLDTPNAGTRHTGIEHNALGTIFKLLSFLGMPHLSTPSQNTTWEHPGSWRRAFLNQS